MKQVPELEPRFVGDYFVIQNLRSIANDAFEPRKVVQSLIPPLE
jgi:hypothetical protein